MLCLTVGCCVVLGRRGLGLAWSARSLSCLVGEVWFCVLVGEAWVLANVGNGERMEYVVVSPHEADLRAGRISIKSPIARALLGHKAGDTVEVRVPSGTLSLRIDSVESTAL